MSDAVEAHKELALIVHLANTKPLELIDLGQSFEALGDLYSEFAHSKGYEPLAGNARLYIVELRSGSIIATLKGLLDQASFLVDHLDVLSGFLANVNDLIKFFTVQQTTKEVTVTRSEALQLSKIIEPIAKDGGAQIVFEIKGNTAPVTVNNIIVTSERANAIQNNVRRFLGPATPESGSFENEVLYLQQMRGDSETSIGDRGVIEKFSMRPVKLYFMTPEVKAAVLDQPYPRSSSSQISLKLQDLGKIRFAWYHDPRIPHRDKRLSDIAEFPEHFFLLTEGWKIGSVVVTHKHDIARDRAYRLFTNSFGNRKDDEFSERYSLTLTRYCYSAPCLTSVAFSKELIR